MGEIVLSQSRERRGRRDVMHVEYVFRHAALVIINIILIVAVADGNTPPEWLRFQTAVMVEEDSPVGRVIQTISVSDPEGDDVTFELIETNCDCDVLILENSSTIDNITTVDVVLNMPLDREVEDQYSFEVEVSDAISKVRRRCTLFVLDVNDNAPQFIGTPYREYVSENATIGKVVKRVTAEDPDSGIFGLFTFSLEGGMGLFVVDRIDGDVTVAANLASSPIKYFTLYITAGDSDSLNTTVTMEIILVDAQNQTYQQPLSCFSCRNTEDCSKEQLSCASTKKCEEGQYCQMEGVRTTDGSLSYMRGCANADGCPTSGEEKCTDLPSGSVMCWSCCDSDICNRGLFYRYRLDSARALVTGSSSRASSRQPKMAYQLISMVYALYFVANINKIYV